MNRREPETDYGRERPKGTPIVQKLTALAIVAPALAWLSFFWERCTGLTFVLSKHSTDLGSNSDSAHLHHTLNLAIGATLLGAATVLCVTLLKNRT